MKIIILTAIPLWHPGTQELIDNLRNNGLDVTALDIFHGKLLNENNDEINLVLFGMKGILARLFLKLFRKYFTKKNTSEADIIDIHFVEPAYSKYVISLPNKIICTLFGSDLFRTDEAKKKKQLPLFNKCDGIVLSQNMAEYFNKSFPGHEHKFIYNQYGTNNVDLIVQAKKKFNRKKTLETFGLPQDKIIIICSYNGKKEQQHLQLLKKLDELPQNYKNKIFIIIPLTYYEELTYVRKVISFINNMDIPSWAIQKRLSKEEIVSLRLISDITINTQTTDALAGSLKEAIAAGSVLMAGNWLPYDIYDKLGIFYIKIRFETLNEDLKNILDDFHKFQNQSSKNAEIIQKFASWKFIINDWINGYKKIYHQKNLLPY